MAAATTFGKYQVQRVLGRGGMGTVYEALDPQLNRKVALKTMIPGLLGDPGLRARFLREAQAAGSLNHRNIVTVYDLGEDKGQPFIAMEFIEGTDLERIIVGRESYPIEWKVDVLRQVCRGLGHAHRNGIIHRDVKPANIRVTPDGEVKIMDFGIAHLQTPTQLTKGGQVLGTVHYMAPEQIEGGVKVDHRADIFSVGAIAFELITYRRPFDGDSLTSIMFRIAHEDPDRSALPRTVFSPRLEEIVMKALAREIGERYQSLQEMESEIEVLLRDVPSLPHEPVDPQVVSGWVRDGEQALTDGDSESALAFAKRALAVAPANAAAQALARRAEAEALRRRVEGELAAIRSEIARAREQGHLQKALGLAQRLLQLDPDDQEVAQTAHEIQETIKSLEVDQLCSMALSYAAEGDVELALKIASKIERVAPESPKYVELKKYLLEESARRTAEAFVATAREHLGLGNVAEALAAAEEALAASPAHPVAREIRERAYHVLATQSKVEVRPDGQVHPPTPPPAPATPSPPPPEVPETVAMPAPPPAMPAAPPPVSAPPAAEPPPAVAAPAPPPAEPAAPMPSVAEARPEMPIPPAAPAPPPPEPLPVAEPPLVPVPEAIPPARRPTPPPRAPTPAPVMKHEDAEALLADLGPGAERAAPRPAPARPPSTPAPARAPTPATLAAKTPAPAAGARELANGEPPPPLTPLPEGNPEDAEAARLLEQARRTLRNRQPQKALATLEKAAAIEPTHLGIQRLLVQTRIESRKAELDTLVSAAVNHFVANEYGKAKKAVTRILELDPNNKKAKELSGILGALG